MKHKNINKRNLSSIIFPILTIIIIGVTTIISSFYEENWFFDWDRITDKMVNDYLEHHRGDDKKNNDNFIIE